MMYSCAPASKASTVVAKKKSGKSLTVDLHCHYANPDVAAKVADRNPAQYDPNVKFASALTRETNQKQMRDRAPKLSSIEVRLKDLDRAGRRAGAGAHGERAPRRDRVQVARPLRRARHRAFTGFLSRRKRARACRETTRLARCRDQPERERHGSDGSKAEPGALFRE